MPKQVPKLADVEASSLPFSQVVEANGLVFLAGQVGGRPGGHGRIEGSIEDEVAQMLENVARLLRAVGLDLANVVKSTVYLVDMDDFERMNGVYRRYFPSDPPTRATVGVSRLAADYRVEIEVIAAR